VVGIDFTGLKDYGKGRRATSTVGLIEKRREKRLDSDRPEIS
jgi:hypothetical protein